MKNSKARYLQNKEIRLLPDEIEYVIYARRSSDESSGNQTQSIPSQIQKCIEFAKNNGLIIAQKPSDFPKIFETELDIIKEDNEPEELDRKFFQDTRHLYIVKESHSAKEPHQRPKRNELMRLIKVGKVLGLLSYSPDRQSRNMLEGGQLIDYVDKGFVDLKYCNFAFENSASGRMMLGIWFVFSKQYSDKLSEDIRKGNERMMEKGKATGSYKYGYIVNEKGYYEPHPIFFDHIKQAFRKKLAGVSDKAIKERLDSQNFYRETKAGRVIELNEKTLYKMWIDPFYYGMHHYGENVSNQMETNEYFEPAITEEQHCILLERYRGNLSKQSQSVINEDLYYVTPFPDHCVKTEDGTSLTRTVPNWKKRMRPKVLELRKTKPDSNLGDIVKPNQIRCVNENKHSKFHGYAVSFFDIETNIIKFLKTFKPNKQAYDAYIEYIIETNKNKEQITKEEKNKLQLQINRINGDIRKLTDSKLRNRSDFNDKDRSQFETKMATYEKQKEQLQKEMKGLDASFRHEMMECEQVLIMLQKLAYTYEKADYVQKRLIAEIIGLNIVLDGKKKLTITVNPLFESFFSLNGGRTWTGTMDLFLIREAL